MRAWHTAVVLLGIAAVSRAAEDTAPRVAVPLAIRGLTLHVAPGEHLEDATIVIDDGRIVAVGRAVDVPAHARVIDGTGLHAYAGFIDMLSRAGVTEQRPRDADERRVEGDADPISETPSSATPEADRNGLFARRSVADLLDVTEETFADARRSGFTAALLCPPRAIVGGRASLVDLGDRPLRSSIIRLDAVQTASFEAPRERALRLRGRYPRTPLGVSAHLRQFFSDAHWYADMTAWTQRHPGQRDRLPVDEDLTAMQAVLGGQPVLFEANRDVEIGRALDLAAELGFRPILAGGREAYRAIDRLKTADATVVVALRSVPKPRKFDPDAAVWRPEDEAASPYAREWDKRPFEPQGAWDAATRRRDSEIGTMLALERAGVPWCLATAELKRPRTALRALREALAAGLPTDAALAALTVTPARVLGLDSELGTLAAGKRANLTLFTKPFAEKDAAVRWVVIDGRIYDATPPRARPRARERDGERSRPGERDESEERDDADEPGGDERAPTTAATAPADPLADIRRHVPDWAIETEASRDPGVHTGGNVLLRNATVLTVSGPDLPNTDVLVQGGKIAAIGARLSAPAGVAIYDLTGCVLMPGIIDPHSHIALSAVNEWTLSVTPEVRCADVVDPTDPDIYFALSGGTTAIHAMHGSANTIGGQCIQLKLKYGRPVREMLIPDQHRTVKFALGENVKRPGMRENPRDRSNDPLRFPGTRMGVETVMRRALANGRNYAEQCAAFAAATAAGKDPAPLRRDFRLEALADILRGDIWVNCHCYRADEILRLISVAEDFGFRVAMLHHVLEAYRIMPEIARHGAATATFSDWWAYKIEAYDAVPQNAGMLLRAGINSTIKSDSSDLMRHMNLEAAKCLKYSGLTTNEALRLITLNAAKGFGLDGRLGSIEVGKDADIAVFDGHPLDTFAKCVLTLIEGEVYFRHRDFDPVASKGAPRELKQFMTAALTVPAAPPAEHHGTNGHEVVAAIEPLVAAGAAGLSRYKPLDVRLVWGAKSQPTPEEIAAAPFVIANATVHPVSRPAIEKCALLIRDGRIAEIGPDVLVPENAWLLDAGGRHVYPGLINAATEVGLYEIGQVGVTVDAREGGRFEPDLAALSAVNPHSAMVETTRAEGVLTIGVVPNGPTVAGRAGVLHLDGWTAAEMLVARDWGLVVNLPSVPPRPIIDEQAPDDDDEDWDDEKPDPDDIQVKLLRELERLFREARVYAEAARAAARDGRPSPIPSDPRFDALAPFALGEKPVLFAVQSYKPILEALLLAERLDLRPVILGGRDAWKLADVLARRNVPVIYEGVFALPARVSSAPLATDAWDGNYRAASILAKAGVKFCFAHRGADLAKLIPVEAGFAVAHGLDPDAALKALTLWPAEILGVADQVGTLDVGKVANVIVTTDHPCQATSRVEYAFIRGRPISLESKHTRDAARFAARPGPLLPAEVPDLKGPTK